MDQRHRYDKGTGNAQAMHFDNTYRQPVGMPQRSDHDTYPQFDNPQEQAACVWLRGAFLLRMLAAEGARKRVLERPWGFRHACDGTLALL